MAERGRGDPQSGVPSIPFVKGTKRYDNEQMDCTFSGDQRGRQESATDGKTAPLSRIHSAHEYQNVYPEWKCGIRLRIEECQGNSEINIEQDRSGTFFLPATSASPAK